LKPPRGDGDQTGHDQQGNGLAYDHVHATGLLEAAGERNTNRQISQVPNPPSRPLLLTDFAIACDSQQHSQGNAEIQHECADFAHCFSVSTEITSSPDDRTELRKKSRQESVEFT
jgi:hypothetical protein